jgi:hypothetical protein
MALRNVGKRRSSRNLNRGIRLGDPGVVRRGPSEGQKNFNPTQVRVVIRDARSRRRNQNAEIFI